MVSSNLPESKRLKVMPFVPATCPSCGGDLQIPEERDVVKCMYCGTDMVVRDAIKKEQGPDPANLLSLAVKAQGAGNSSEAIDYCNRVLETDPENHRAWFIKGRATGWSSTLSNFRIGEMTSAFRHAVENAPNDVQDSLHDEAARKINQVCMAFYASASNHFSQFDDLESAWGDYLVHCSQIIAGLEAAHAFDPENKNVLNNLVEICQDNIEGKNYRAVVRGYHVSSTHSLSDEYEAKLRKKREKYAEKLKQLDPEYAPSPIQKKETGCFIATAAEGSFDAPSVLALRQFRDEILRECRWGRACIKMYYRVGPHLARIIEHRDSLRAATRRIIVRPAAWVVRKLVV